MFTIGTSSDVLRSFTLQEAIKIVSDSGFDTIELWMGHITDSPLSTEEIKALLHRYHLNFQIHADVRDVNLTSINKGIRSESVKQTLQTIKFAKELGAELITLHPGRMSSSKDRPEEIWPMQIQVFKEIAVYAEKYGIKIGLENMEKRPKEFIMTNEATHRLIKEVNNPYLGLTLDLAHAHSLGDVAAYVQSIEVPIFNVHISQASRKKMHLPFTADWEDCINFDPILPYLFEKYKGVLVNEAYAHGKEKTTLTSAYKTIRGIISRFQTQVKLDNFGG